MITDNHCWLFKSTAVMIAILFPNTSFAMLQDELPDKWTYVSNDAKSASKSQMTIWFSESAPQNIKIESEFDFSQALFGFFQYGSTQSRYIALAIVTVDSESELFIDLNRNQILTDDERIANDNGIWETELDAEFFDPGTPQPRHSTRKVRFRPSRFGKSISYSTSAYLSGRLKFDHSASKSQLSGQPDSGDKNLDSVLARICDANGNGQFGDPDDELWVDLDQDNKFNAFTEKSICRKGVSVDGKRYQLVSDSNASRFYLKSVVGSGKIEFVLGGQLKVLVANLLLIGKDGTSVAIQLPDWKQPATETVPVGVYRIASLSLSLFDSLEQKKWHYTFSGYKTGKNAKWFPVTKDRTTRIAPFDDLRFEINVESETGNHQPGELLRVTPTLITASGLVINNCWTGEENLAWMQNSEGATLRLSGGNSKQKIVACSGFK